MTGDGTDQGRIVHSQHDDALVLGAIFAPSADVGFDDVAAVLFRFFGSVESCREEV